MQTQALSGCVISLDPLVIMAARNDSEHLGLATLHPEWFEGRPSLHFIKPTHSMMGRVEPLPALLKQMAERLPLAKFVIMANEELELVELQSHGVTSFVANNFLLIDENTFVPQPGAPRKYDAIYNAMFRAVKNHQLCARIPSLALIYYPLEGYSEAAYERDMRQLLKHADVLNEPGGGPYRYMGADEVVAAINASHVGLCLSEKEGAMRACCEFLLCGIPVVTVPALGGRMRYLSLWNSRVVEPDAVAVAEAVAGLKNLNLDPYEIREDFLSIIEFERRNFLAYINACIEKHFGVANCVRSFAGFRGASNYTPIWKWKQWLGAA
ncbi:MAG: hypothetical protein IPM06_02430 [Rhizobiales bacterium]|nr:hypothetical protein [Hyphomicrobiales bacterium]